VNNQIVINGIDKTQWGKNEVKGFLPKVIVFAFLGIGVICASVFLVKQKPRLGQETLEPVQEIERQRYQSVALIESGADDAQQGNDYPTKDGKYGKHQSTPENDTQHITPSNRTISIGRCTC
jgi:hypothetical protein